MVNERGRGFVSLSGVEKREEMCDTMVEKKDFDDRKCLERSWTCIGLGNQ